MTACAVGCLAISTFFFIAFSGLSAGPGWTGWLSDNLATGLRATRVLGRDEARARAERFVPGGGSFVVGFEPGADLGEGVVVPASLGEGRLGGACQHACVGAVGIGPRGVLLEGAGEQELGHRSL